MSTKDRREFLKETVAGVAGMSVLGQWQPADARDHHTAPDSQIPPHHPLNLPGVHAYAKHSVAAGEGIDFHVSSTVPYELSICRLGHKIDDPDSVDILHTFERSKPKTHPIHMGSYVHVDKTLPADLQIKAFSLTCWVRPWRIEGHQGLMTQCDFDQACGWGLFIDEGGRAAFYLGDGKRYRESFMHAGPTLEQRRWHHVVGTFDGKTKRLWVDGRKAGQWPISQAIVSGNASLRLAACGKNGLASMFLDGDLCMPAIFGRALTSAEVVNEYSRRGLEPTAGEDLLACWKFDEELGSVVTDVSGHERHGQIINKANWMIGGPSFLADRVERYGDYRPFADPKRGHGLRFAADDLYDCRWPVAHSFQIPKDARSGIYVGRFRFDLNGNPMLYHVTFIVRKAQKMPKAPLLVLAATSTWLAYNRVRLGLNLGHGHAWGGSEHEPNSPGNPTAYSMYNNHRAGQPPYQMGLKMPCSVSDPYGFYGPREFGHSHLVRAERFTHVWLEQNGYDYDLISDLDLHHDPDQLKGYEALMILGHSEYWTAKAYKGVERYLGGGGDLVVLSGNVMFWRVTFDKNDAVMECRKHDPHLGGRPGATVGELYHSHDGRRGSLMRECGYPAWKLVGLECIGWWSPTPDSFGIFHAENTDHFLFHHPHQVGVGTGETFGHAPGGGSPHILGDEADARISTLRRLTKKPFPKGAMLPEEPAGIVGLARGLRKAPAEGIYFDYFGRLTKSDHGHSGDLIYWQRPDGGRVFNTGAIATGQALQADPKLEALLRNVLSHFGVEPT